MASAPASPSRLALWGPVVAYMALTFVLSAMPSPPSPAGVSDKLEHFVFYGGLALVTLRATARGRIDGLTPLALVLAWVITTGYGVTDEMHQAFVPQRTPDVADVAADALGATVALIAAAASGIILRSRRAAGGR